MPSLGLAPITTFCHFDWTVLHQLGKLQQSESENRLVRIYEEDEETERATQEVTFVAASIFMEMSLFFFFFFAFHLALYQIKYQQRTQFSNM